LSSVDITVKPLINGERMSREEFLGRWDLLPELKRAELIRGVVHTASPLSLAHGKGDTDVSLWLGYYAAHTPGTEAFSNASVLILDDVPQPDVCLRIKPEFGGRSGQRGPLVAGPVELIAEIAVTSGDIDLGEKLRLYEEAGVREYIVVEPGARVTWQILEGDRYTVSPPDADGVHRSRVFPGLWLDPAALLAGDGPRILETLNRGLAGEEHGAFIARLASQRESRLKQRA
jgi:Uma2 family endonuclease